MKLWIIILFIPCILIACSSDSAPTSTVSNEPDNPPPTEEAVQYNFEDENAEFKPGMIVRIQSSNGNHEHEEYTGDIDDVTYTIHRDPTDSELLLFTIPELLPGYYTLFLHINDDVAELDFEALEVEQIENPELLIENFISELTYRFDVIKSNLAETEELQIVETFFTEIESLKSDLEALESDKKQKIARFIYLLNGDNQTNKEKFNAAASTDCQEILNKLQELESHWEDIAIRNVFRLGERKKSTIARANILSASYKFILKLRADNACLETNLYTNDVNDDNRIVLNHREAIEVSFIIAERIHADFEDEISNFIEYIIDLNHNIPTEISEFIRNAGKPSERNLNLSDAKISEVSSSDIEGEIFDDRKLLFAYTGTVMTEEAHLFDFILTSGEIDQRFDALLEGAERPYGGPYDAHFTIDGVDYSAQPVTKGYITGFGGSGPVITGTDASPGRLWYGGNACYAFGMDGNAKADAMGGTGINVNRFGDNLVSTSSHPGLATAPSVPLIPSLQVHPDFNRSDAVEEFKWGVQLDEDGFPKRDFQNRWVFYIKFSSDSEFDSGTYGWEEGEETPISRSWAFDSPLGSISRDASNSPYCFWKEPNPLINGEQEPHCRTRSVSYFGEYGPALTYEECYSSGLNHGDFTITMADGTEVLRGNYNKGLPANQWFIGYPNGLMRASGRFNENGMRIGEWIYNFNDGAPHYVLNIKSWKETGFGYHEILDGFYHEYFRKQDDSYSFLGNEGKYIEGYRDGWWFNYDEEGRLQEAKRFNGQQLIPHFRDEYCTSDNSYCEPALTHWREEEIYYSWGTCIPDRYFYRRTTYASDGSQLSQSCREFDPDWNNRSAPESGDTISCPVACSR